MSADETMKISTALATEVGREQTARGLAGQLSAALPDRRVDLCLLFASAHFEDEIEEIALRLQDLLRPQAFIGTTAETVIRGDREYESRPALALWAASLPGARLRSFHLSQEDLERFDSPEALQEHLALTPDVAPHFILLGDPFSFNVLELLEQLEAAYPDRPAIGGMASAAEEPGQNALVFDGQTLHHGLTGVGLWGNVQVDTVVSQGCRPIGHHLVITKAERNVIYQLGGKPPLAVVTEMLADSPVQDRELARRRGLLIGRVINEYQDKFARGDFLIRNPIGFDTNSGAMALNDLVRIGQTIQFHVRDGEAASEDLASLLSVTQSASAAGALLFDCSGRGTRLFSRPHHDARAIAQHCGSLPVAGFFCAGEVGPIGRRNFLHGHTASIAFFRPAADRSGA